MRFQVEDDGIPGLTLALRLRLKGHEVGLTPKLPPIALEETFTLPAPFRDLLLKTGDPMEAVCPLVPAPALQLPYDGTTVTFPVVGPHSQVLADLGSDQARQWRLLMRDAAEIWSEVRLGMRDSERSSIRRARQSLQDPHLLTLFRAYLAERGVDADRSGDSALVLPYLDQTFGCWRFEHGLKRLESELRARCRGLGIDGNAGQEISAKDHWNSTFALPRRWWSRSSHSDAPTGLPWTGMAADFVATRVGRAVNA